VLKQENIEMNKPLCSFLFTLILFISSCSFKQDEILPAVHIENGTFDQGEDAIALKSGSNWDAWRLATPSKNIVIRNCMVKNGHQLRAIGSELSRGIKNINLYDCRVTDGAKMFHLIFIKSNERNKFPRP
jgi:hypothetical protein